MEERGVNVDHATLNRWVIRFAINMANPPKINLDTPALCTLATQ
jgi:transposase-like protein